MRQGSHWVGHIDDGCTWRCQRGNTRRTSHKSHQLPFCLDRDQQLNNTQRSSTPYCSLHFSHTMRNTQRNVCISQSYCCSTASNIRTDSHSSHPPVSTRCSIWSLGRIFHGSSRMLRDCSFYSISNTGQCRGYQRTPHQQPQEHHLPLLGCVANIGARLK